MIDLDRAERLIDAAALDGTSHLPEVARELLGELRRLRELESTKRLAAALSPGCVNGTIDLCDVALLVASLLGHA